MPKVVKVDGEDLIQTFGVPYSILLVETCITDVMLYLTLRSNSAAIFVVSLVFILTMYLIELVVSAYFHLARNGSSKVMPSTNDNRQTDSEDPALIKSSLSSLKTFKEDLGDYITAATSIPTRRESMVSAIN
jgi:hypothetical protein